MFRIRSVVHIFGKKRTVWLSDQTVRSFLMQSVSDFGLSLLMGH